MAVALAHLRGRRDRSSRALAGSLRSTALGRLSLEERAWAERIEAWRRSLASERELAPALRAAGLEPAGDGDYDAGVLAGCVPYWSIPRVWGRFMLRLVRELGPASCLELGTGFGVSAAYAAAGLELNREGGLVTLDGGGQWSSIAERGWAQFGLERRISLRVGEIEDTVEEVLERLPPVDYALIDADHTELATVAHFDAMRPHLAPGAVVLLDDIWWTEEQQRAWSTITGRPGIALGLEVGRVGIVVTSDAPDGAPDAQPVGRSRSDWVAAGATRLKGRFPPDSPLASAGHRALWIASLPRFARRGDQPSRALARALRSTALGRIPADERAWLERVDVWRSRLGSERELAELLAADPASGEDAGWPASELAGAIEWWSLPRFWGRLLMRLVRELSPDSCLELGTGFGISAAYHGAALELNGSGALVSIEARERWAAAAERGLDRLGLGDRVKVERGTIEGVLPSVLDRVGAVDYAFVDAEHSESATLGYLDALRPHLASHSVLVFDDVQWSWPEMRRAWRAIRRQEAGAIRLGRMGVVVGAGR